MRLSDTLRERGLLVPGIRPPTVPEGQSRLRISLSASHTEDERQALIAALAALRPRL
jgi:8-amino-7-oxononanoate synthase